MTNDAPAKPKSQTASDNERPSDNAFRKFRAKANSGGTVGKSTVLQSQRDCVFQPGVARHELPWVPGPIVFNPNGVASGFKVLRCFAWNGA